jgi:hypothetical protein
MSMNNLLKFYKETYNPELLVEVLNRRKQEITKLDSRASKRAASQRQKLLYYLKAIQMALAITGEQK